MNEREVSLGLKILMFKDPALFSRYLHTRNIIGLRAVGVQYEDGSREIAIDTSYYLLEGIHPEQLMAIIVHERIELTNNDPDAHSKATEAEYRYIRDHFGSEELNNYHTRLCNLMGGRNEVRNLALQIVISEV